MREAATTFRATALEAKQGKKTHKDVEATKIHHLNPSTQSITATKAKPLTNDKQADIFLSGVTSIDNPVARDWFLDVTSTNPFGVINQEFIKRAVLGHQPGPGEHDPRNDVDVSPAQSARRIRNIASTTPSARQRGLSSLLSRSRLRAGTGPPPRRWTPSSPSSCATRVCWRTCSWHDCPSDYSP